MAIRRLKASPGVFVPSGAIVIVAPSPAHRRKAQARAEAEAARAGCEVRWERVAPDARRARGIVKPILAS